MKRKNSGFVMTTILLDPKVRKDFEKLLPKDKTLAEAVREYMQSVVDEEKKDEALRIPIVNQDLRQASMYEYINISINNLLGINEDTINNYIKTVAPKKLDEIYNKFGRFATCIAIMD